MFSRIATLAVALLAPCTGLATPTAITSITDTTTTGTPTTVTGTNTITFDNTDTKLTSFTTGTTTYNVSQLATSAYVRRNTASTSVDANNSSVWYNQSAGSSTTMLSSYGTDMNTVLLGNDLNRGADNVFANGTGAPDGNIERLDFEFSGPVSATSSLAFAVFERGVAAQHDGFSIAVITGVDASGTPTSYGGNVVTTTTAEYGSTNVYTPPSSYTLFRYGNDGNNLSTWTADTETGSQGLGGVVVTLSDLGIAPGTVIYGYSLMATDVTTSTTNLVDWTNATYYPTNSSDATDAAGGLDPSAVNGVLFAKSAAPEPALYGAALTALALAGAVYLRSRRAPVSCRMA